MSATDPTALNPFNFNGPFAKLSLNTVTMNSTLDVPFGTSPLMADNTVLELPSGFTVAALFPSTSLTNPNTFALSIFFLDALVAVAVNLRHDVFPLLGMY